MATSKNVDNKLGLSGSAVPRKLNDETLSATTFTFTGKDGADKLYLTVEDQIVKLTKNRMHKQSS